MEKRIVDLQVLMVWYLRERWGLNIKEFLEIDEKYGILEYIRLCYEPFHLTGDEGIAIEIEEYIKEQGGVIPK